jgi:hypothetical protein
MSVLFKYNQNTSIREREGRKSKEKPKGDKIFSHFVPGIKVKEYNFIFLNAVKQSF